jgi:putative NIF3 family GTP cyclohydrolase 1 type 2
MTINNIISEIELVAALAYQEEYDNSGLITGQKEWNTTGVLFSLDCTEEI